ncbi:MAG: hypothetical protein LBV47_05370 [Bacteroidales bacterium]|jgi:hypothetical protein|nr:hypothetical protein [Bacteroidales bacterium]
MDYFLLNINVNHKNEVDRWISKNEFAPIFYGTTTIDQILNNQTTLTPLQFRDAYLFVTTFKEQREDVIVLSIGNEHVYIYKQEGELGERDERPYKGELTKGCPIEILKKEEIKKCPLILTTIKSSRYMSAGTFREINREKYLGNVLSLEYVLSGQRQKVNSFKEYLLCLSSLEFETLIAKMFEENGYFVPAYKGGYIKDFDLFCRKGEETRSLQIKLKMGKEDNKNVDSYYCIINETKTKRENVKDWEDVEQELKDRPKTMKWLNKTLHWVILSKE